MTMCVHCEGCWGPRLPHPRPQPPAEAVLAADSSQLSLSLRNCLKLKGTIKPQVCPLPWSTVSATTGVKKPDPSQLRKIPAPKILPGVDQRPLLQLPQKERQRQRQRDCKAQQPTTRLFSPSSPVLSYVSQFTFSFA